MDAQCNYPLLGQQRKSLTILRDCDCWPEERLARQLDRAPLEVELEDSSQPVLVELTAKIVSAYVSNNSVIASELPHLISETHAALSRASGGALSVEREEQKPKVPVKKSVMPDYLICLEDGKKFKSLKRHLRTHYNLSPEEYREKWGLPHDYPMVAPNYARARSDLAKKMGLGTRRER
jgi:predicted transcriptional regulator